MALTTYTPNFNDPRVIKRCLKAIGFTKALVSTTKEASIASRTIDKHFGHSGDNLSKYLRKKLLICVDPYFNKDTGKCKKYVYSAESMRDLMNKINIDKPPAVEWGKKTYNDELKTLNFKYNDKSHRLWNPIQNMKSAVRDRLLADAGLIYQYDIVCCAPTLLYQHSRIKSLWTLEFYLNNRAEIREHLAEGLEVDKKVVKEFINSLFAGAVISTSPVRAVMAMFSNDIAKIEFIKQDTFIQLLHNDIKSMWQPIIASAPVEYIIDKNGKKRKKPFNSRAKWNVYFRLEREILDAQIEYMKERKIKSFLLHDGIFTNTKIDVKTMTDYIKEKTGYDVQLEEMSNTIDREIDIISNHTQ